MENLIAYTHNPQNSPSYKMPHNYIQQISKHELTNYFTIY